MVISAPCLPNPLSQHRLVDSVAKGSFCRQVVETPIFSRVPTASCAADPACLAYDYQLKTGAWTSTISVEENLHAYGCGVARRESRRGRFSCRNDFVVCEKVSPPPPPPPPPSPNLLPAACSCPSTSSQKYTLVKRGAKCPSLVPRAWG